MNRKKITIFTTTYNRANLLKKAYASIICQENKENLVWLIVDDGSTDNTKSVVDSFIKEKLIEIKYIYQENKGKYVAHNVAIENIDTEYCFCLDSDDFLLTEGIEIILDKISEFQENSTIGYVFPRGDLIEKLNNEYVNISDIKLKYGKAIETTIVFKTDIIKKEYFETNEEKFQSEEILYNHLIKYGKFLFINENVVGGDYLSDGMTKNIYKLWFNNPKNSLKLFSSRYIYIKENLFGIKKVKELSKCVINKNALCKKRQMPIIKNSDNRILSVLLFLPSLCYMRIKYGK